MELPVAHPLFGPALSAVGGRLEVGDPDRELVGLLRYGRGVDNRRLREELGFEPRFDAVGVVRRFARRAPGPAIAPAPALATAVGRLVGNPR
jgi:hypothetical protein